MAASTIQSNSQISHPNNLSLSIWSAHEINKVVKFVWTSHSNFEPLRFSSLQPGKYWKYLYTYKNNIIYDKNSSRVVNNFFYPTSACTCLWYHAKSQRKKKCNSANIFWHIERHIWDSAHQCKVSNAVRLPNSSTCKTRNRNRLRSLNCKILLK